MKIVSSVNHDVIIKTGSFIMPNLNKRFVNAIIFLSLLLAGAVIARADVKIKSKQTSSGQTMENTTYIKGKRTRTESAGGQLITIQQCDLRRDLQLMPQSQVYRVTRYDQTAAAVPGRGNAAGPTAAPTRGGTITSTITTRDTGERRQMFGYNARHIITTIETVSSADACNQNNSKMEIDGWYIDAEFVVACETDRYTNPVNNGSPTGCQDKYQTKQVGTAKRGYSVVEKMTMMGPDGKPSFSMTNEVTELSQATLDASLFDVPAGYREVEDFSASQVAGHQGGQSSSQSHLGSNTDDGPSFTMPNAGDAGTQSASANSPAGMNGNAQSLNNQSTAPAPGGDLAAKREGVIRLGLATVKTGAVGDGVDANQLAAAVRNTLVDYLKSPNIEVIPIEARLPAAIDAEAKQKDCDYVIYATVSHKKGGGGFGSMFGKVAPVMGNVVPMGGQGGVVAATAINTAASASSNVKPKDEVTLELRLQIPGSASPVLAKQYKAKAQSAGQDIITPVVEPAAQAIVDQIASNNKTAIVR